MPFYPPFLWATFNLKLLLIVTVERLFSVKIFFLDILTRYSLSAVTASLTASVIDHVKKCTIYVEPLIVYYLLLIQ